MVKMFGYFSFVLLVAMVPAGFAHSYGPPPRVTGGAGDNAKACTQCHTTNVLNSGTGSVKILLTSGASYIPGVRQRVTVQVADDAQQRWGFELSARPNSDLENSSAGDFTSIDNFTQVICADASAKPCASGPSFVHHTTVGTRNGQRGSANFVFDWTPPATNVGPITFFVAGNAANGNGSPAGDQIYTTSMVLSPLTPAAPAVTAGNIVSAATSTAGPVGQNSWVSIYGTNLSATTRSWTDVDFVNGATPTVLDGVSVVLTAGGPAPRLVPVGYVSPTQVNFLLPIDVNPATVQIQLKNPAGITPQLPLTAAANTPQLLTLDGKYAAGAHANGSLVGKTGLISSSPTTPAAPGETITLYATGCGNTTPALVSGQLPVAGASLATLPTATIGGADAPVLSGVIVSPGLYQIRVTVPANAANGDLPVVMLLGGNSSASTLVTIQK